MALGCIGMGYDDFCRCTPSEFRAVCDRWRESEEWIDRGEWERVRMMCLCMIQPYSKKKLQARDIMEFEWEKNEVKTEQKDAPVISREEEMKRYESAKRMWGLK
ncbi:MAG: hypothetical protein HUJ99_08210 [Bacteroidaceae bacterium]|nr:hypothetical protein [Bacteroidaceae bacterium]